VTEPGQPVAAIERVPPDNRTAHIMAPCLGKVSATAASNSLPSGEYAIPHGPLFTTKSYPDSDGQNGGIDPFQELREACAALEKSSTQLRKEQAAREDTEEARGWARIEVPKLRRKILLRAIGKGFVMSFLIAVSTICLAGLIFGDHFNGSIALAILFAFTSFGVIIQMRAAGRIAKHITPESLQQQILSEMQKRNTSARS
jgi:hypothetical protein